ncbi:MAG: hypothetical protein IT449_17890 [Phycisphaerales bacterium]|nr:hypothetical protein [Phycisphaerales bacterium]
MTTHMLQILIMARGILLSTSLALLESPVVQAQPDSLVLERIVIRSSKAWTFCCAQEPMFGKPLLVIASQLEVEMFDVFGGSQPLSDPHFRWTIGEDVAFVTRSVNHLGSCSVTRYPLFALIHPPPASAWPFDDAKVSSKWISPQTGRVDLDFGTVFPYELVKKHGVVWTQDGKAGSVPRSRSEAVFLDILGQSRTSVRLFITIDDDLSIWDKDGSSWRLIKDHAGTIKGPFFATDQGRSFVGTQEDDWGVFSKGGESQLRFTSLVQRHESEPLLLVEDRDASVNYFVFNGVILDQNGEALERLPGRQSAEERLSHILRFALDRRPEKKDP